MLKRLLLALLLGSIACFALAEEYQPMNYFGISYMQLDGGQSGGPDYRPNGVVARLGFMMGDIFGLELQTGLSQSSSGLELNNIAAVYMYAGIPIERLKLFTLAGMARTDVDHANSSEITQNFSFGFGIRWQVVRNLDVVLEWMNYGERSMYNLSAFNIGFVKQF